MDLSDLTKKSCRKVWTVDHRFDDMPIAGDIITSPSMISYMISYSVSYMQDTSYDAQDA